MFTNVTHFIRLDPDKVIVLFPHKPQFQHGMNYNRDDTIMVFNGLVMMPMNPDVTNKCFMCRDRQCVRGCAFNLCKQILIRIAKHEGLCLMIILTVIICFGNFPVVFYQLMLFTFSFDDSVLRMMLFTGPPCTQIWHCNCISLTQVFAKFYTQNALSQ